MEAVSRLYRVSHWLWSPIDLLDKRFYVPTIKNLKFFFFNSSDLDVYSDSIFYKKHIVSPVKSKLLNLIYSFLISYVIIIIVYLF